MIAHTQVNHDPVSLSHPHETDPTILKCSISKQPDALLGAQETSSFNCTHFQNNNSTLFSQVQKPKLEPELKAELEPSVSTSSLKRERSLLPDEDVDFVTHSRHALPACDIKLEVTVSAYMSPHPMHGVSCMPGAADVQGAATAFAMMWENQDWQSCASTCGCEGTCMPHMPHMPLLHRHYEALTKSHQHCHGPGIASPVPSRGKCM